jgi:hypothetical protein
MTASYTRVNSWVTGHQGRLVVRNTTTATQPNWVLTFDLAPRISFLSGGQLVSQVVQKVTVKAPTRTPNLVAGGSITIDYFAAGPGVAPTNCKLNGIDCGLPAATTTTTTTVAVSASPIYAKLLEKDLCGLPSGASTARIRQSISSTLQANTGSL